MRTTVHQEEGYSAEPTKIIMNQREAQSDTPQRLCTGCDEPIPAARLRLKPTAKLCARCQELAGDVPRIRRFDEYTIDGETVISTFFTEDAQVEREMDRHNHTPVHFNVSDDDNNKKERGAGISAYSLASAVENDIIDKIDRQRELAAAA